MADYINKAMTKPEARFAYNLIKYIFEETKKGTDRQSLSDNILQKFAIIITTEPADEIPKDLRELEVSLLTIIGVLEYFKQNFDTFVRGKE